VNWNFQEILIKDPSSAWGCDTSGNIAPCGVALRRTCRCTEFHRVKNAKSASPVRNVLTTCHTQYTWDSSIYIFLFNRTTLQVFVTYFTGALYVNPLWFYKHQHDNRVRSIQNAFSLPFAAILVNCAPTGEMHNYCTPYIIKENYENFLIHRCNCILLSQVYCVWQVVKTTTNILNNPVLCTMCRRFSQRGVYTTLPSDLFCTMNQQMHTIISQIITLLHVSTLSCHPQTACNQYLVKLHQYFNCSCR